MENAATESSQIPHPRALLAVNLSSFLSRRTHLFVWDKKRDVITRTPHADDFLQYKRDILQYLADRRPPRAYMDALDAVVRPPRSLPSTFTAQGTHAFLKAYLRWGAGTL